MMYKFVVVLMYTALLSVSTWAQSSQRPAARGRESEEVSLQRAAAREEALVRSKTLPMEGPVDPAEYIVGPSDVFYVAVWGPMSLSHQITVTPEGTLIIPTVGELAVAGKSLERVKTEVREAVRAKYRIGEITVTLMSTREFTVTVKGAVLREGQYTVSAVDRVEKVFLQATSTELPSATLTVPPLLNPPGDPLKEKILDVPSIKKIQQADDRASVRNIRLIRKSGDTLSVDILKYYATGNVRYNPFLLDGDILIVPLRNLSRNFVTVDGAVNAAGRYEFVEGDDLLTLIKIAQGVTTTADKKNIQILRLDERGVMRESFTVDLEAIEQGKAASPALYRGDRIVVNQKPDLRASYSVYVLGAVQSPGRYPISREQTTLTSVLKLAGGFAEDALLSGSFVLRKEQRLEGVIDPRLNLLRAQRATTLTPEDIPFFNLDFEIGRYPVVVDFVGLFEHRDSSKDVVLKDEDIVFIASNLRTVLVQGQVKNPGYIPYVPGMSYRYYIQRAGGFSERAETGDVKVVKNATLDWVDPEVTTIEPGDRIWVPKKPLRDWAFYISSFSTLTSAVVTIATAVLLAIQLTK